MESSLVLLNFTEVQEPLSSMQLAFVEVHGICRDAMDCEILLLQKLPLRVELFILVLPIYVMTAPSYVNYV